MRIAGIVGAALLLGGCALFDGGERPATVAAAVSPARTTASTAPSTTAPTRAKEPFRPAFGIGRPVALVPCANGPALSDDCRNVNERHQRRGDMPAEEESAIFTEASGVPASE